MERGTITAGSPLERENPLFAAAFDFLRREDLARLAPGRHEIVAGVCWANVDEIVLTPAAEEMRYELHRRCCDIQTPVSGPETIGVGPAPAEVPGFDAAKDIGFFPMRGENITLKPGEFAIFAPGVDAHAPGHGDARPHRKVIVKICVGD